MEESSPLELVDNQNDNKIKSETVQSHSNIFPAILKEEANLDFVWNDYLEETGAAEAPPTSFLHVEQSLESGFKEGMKLEIPNRHDGNTYWVASIVVTCGPLLRLRYEGCCDRAAEFWCDVGSSEMHVLGWGEKNGKILEPPQDLSCEVSADLLKDAITVPQSLLEARGATPVDQLKQWMRVEVEDECYRQQVQVATILRNVGGRLLLQCDGNVDSFWLFYLSYRIHAVGWAKENGKEVKANVDPSMLDCDVVPQQIFQNQETIRTHGFRVGLALETVNPFCPDQLCAAVVTKVIDEYYFEITVDVNPSTPRSNTLGPEVIVCYADTPYILPVGWSFARSLTFALPNGYSKDSDFEWAPYLAKRQVQAAPSELFNLTVPDHGFEVGMMLEAVNPCEKAQICAATITKVADHLLWVRLENKGNWTHIVHVKSHEIFPVGWCESNGYPLVAAVAKGRFRVANKVPMVTRSMRKLTDRASGKAWCPCIYFNHKCFSGPYLSKGRIAELPRQVGPGSVILVMKEVLSLIVSVAYQSSRVLSELSARGPPAPGMQHQVLKAKYKGKSYKAMVEIVRSSDKVAEFCRSICRKLECCPYLFGPTFVGEDCPENCSSLTKTKYSVRAPCSRRRKRMGRHHLKKSANPGETCKDSAEVSASQIAQHVQEVQGDEKAVQDAPVKKRKYVHKIHPKLEIVTRKAKLPNYALQLRRRRRRKKPEDVLGPMEQVGAKCDVIHKAIQVALPLFEIVKLEKSPLLWSVDEVVRYMKNTDCAHLARLLKDQEIDGQALLLLTLPTVQEHLELKLEPATMLCQHIEKIKLAFFANFAN